MICIDIVTVFIFFAHGWNITAMGSFGCDEWNSIMIVDMIAYRWMMMMMIMMMMIIIIIVGYGWIVAYNPYFILS